MTDWRHIARQMLDESTDRFIEPVVIEFLKSLPEDQKVLVACSGGADSVFLTLVLLGLFWDSPDRLKILHFNHGLRGDAAAGDEAFVKAMAQGLGLSYESGAAGPSIEASEDALRNARYAWMAEVYQKDGAGALALGHHADDLVESQLMALLRGSGPAGLSSPMPLRRFSDGHVRIRPLLHLRRETIIEQLARFEVPFRTDASNEDTSYTRNRLRKDILPALGNCFPQDIHASALRSRQLMQETVEALDEWIATLGLDVSDPVRFSGKALLGLPEGLVRRALMGWWLNHHPGARIPTASMDKWVSSIASGTTGRSISIGSMEGLGAQTIVIHEDALIELKQESPVPLLRWARPVHWHWLAGPLFLPGGDVLSGKSLTLAKEGTPPYIGANPGQEAWLNGANGPFLVRQWEPGDKYQPLGAPGRRKLQDMFTDAKLNSEQKHALPVILNREGEIAWVPGFPPADRFKICQDSNSALQLTYKRQLTVFSDHHGG
jgi:tRNA(Ile)-lysidine synthase